MPSIGIWYRLTMLFINIWRESTCHSNRSETGLQCHSMAAATRSTMLDIYISDFSGNYSKRNSLLLWQNLFFTVNLIFMVCIYNFLPEFLFRQIFCENYSLKFSSESWYGLLKLSYFLDHFRSNTSFMTFKFYAN